MAVRTTPTLVEGILGRNYDGTTSLTPFIAAASSVVDRVATCASAKGLAISAADLELMETWLAAHFYTKMDPVFTSESQGRSSASYVRDPKTPEPYLSAAMSLDGTGCLSSVLSGRRATGFWLGKRPSEQVPLRDRE